MNIPNLLQLADYLESGKSLYRLNMGIWARGDQQLNIAFADDYRRIVVACAAAHGPAAGLEPRRLEPWKAYTDRVFDLNSKQWLRCFHDKISNSILLVAANIRYTATG